MTDRRGSAAERVKFLGERLRPRLKQARSLKRVVCFGDAAHFVHGTFLGYLWCFPRLRYHEDFSRFKAAIVE